MKVAKKKKRAQASSRGRRVRDKGRAHPKIPKKRSAGKRRVKSARVASGEKKPAMRERKATQRAAAEVKIPALAEKPVAVAVLGFEPEGRGAAPPLPTPIATFNI
jgi:hypothetical protein